MKKRVIKIFDKIILLLLGFSGVLYSCYEYGAIADEYEVNGTVTDKTGKPIQNIRVISPNPFDSDISYTNSEGKFHTKNYGHPYLTIEDIDGEENGGDFETQKINVEFTDADLVKKGRGEKTPDIYKKTINIELETKK